MVKNIMNILLIVKKILISYQILKNFKVSIPRDYQSKFFNNIETVIYSSQWLYCCKFVRFEFEPGF